MIWGFSCCSLFTTVSSCNPNSRGTWAPNTSAELTHFRLAGSAFKSFPPHAPGTCFCTVPVCSFQTAGSFSPMGWGLMSETSAWVDATLGSCLDTHSGFFCCCNCSTLSTHGYTLGAAAVLSQAAHYRYSLLRCATPHISPTSSADLLRQLEILKGGN